MTDSRLGPGYASAEQGLDWGDSIVYKVAGAVCHRLQAGARVGTGTYLRISLSRGGFDS